ncbi:DUF4197 domain-containing protein [Puia dinghuensis]|uniref:DUF4197 domain-containing protein n=1 Tax=Puia dinghuensis TaxID=1792502 RepID=A0A8J2U927_9BACT|nr:DUF4197 domain-containing protein [Puia dinghuensis]GGA87549.1 hypothetical protein GCM10011511_08420 [Puia dinghuensis]
MIKKLTSFLTLFLFSVVIVNAQGSLFDKAKNAITGGSGKGLSSEDIVAGLKDALNHGTQKSTDRLSAVDGFFKDAAVKILLPPEAAKVEKALRSAGFNKEVDDAILSINRAAEDAAKSAAPIFLSAIKNMTVSDGVSILRGPDTAATGYLRKSTSAQLTASFRPVIDSSLQKTGATKYWKQIFDLYNKIPFHSKVNSDLPSYTTDKALYGVFYYVAVEEKNIRQNPAAQVDDLLKKVFGK